MGNLILQKNPIFVPQAIKYITMDKRIHTLTFLFVIYFIVAVSMTLFVPVQKFMTMFIFGISGISIFLMFFGIWLLQRGDH